MSQTLEAAHDLGAYLAAVRAELGDLTADELDELTGGLEADLADALAVPQDIPASPAEMFGPPKTYAAELRSAAGFPPRTRIRRPRGVFVRALMQAADQVREDARRHFGRALTTQAWWPATRDFLRAIQPVWWGFRALLTYWYISQLGSQGNTEPLGKDLGLPYSPLTWLAMAVLLILSVELGRHRRPAVIGAVTIVLNLWLLTLVLLVVPVDLYWTP